MIALLSHSLVLVGALILLGSLLIVRQIIRRLPIGRARSSWFAMSGLIMLFVFGYLGYTWVFWNQHSHVRDLIVPCVFFFGACFVALSSLIALKTAIDVMRVTILERESLTDPLTGVYNRRFMEQRLREEIANARRYGLELAVLLVDIDHFKRVNDDFGHQAGDQVITDVCGLITQELRDSDILARYGGEEFLVIAPNTSQPHAIIFAERLRCRIESHDFRPGPTVAPIFETQLTISIGVANFGGVTGSQENLIRLADSNLYEAKTSGRNRVVAEAAIS